MFVQAAPGLVIRDPVLRDLLPPEGREVPDHHPYWQRRLRDGDVVPAEPAASTDPGVFVLPPAHLITTVQVDGGMGGPGGAGTVAPAEPPTPDAAE